MWSAAVIAIVTNLPSILQGINGLLGHGAGKNPEKHATAVRELRVQEQALGIEDSDALAKARDAAITANVSYQNALARAKSTKK